MRRTSERKAYFHTHSLTHSLTHTHSLTLTTPIQREAQKNLLRIFWAYITGVVVPIIVWYKEWAARECIPGAT